MKLTRLSPDPARLIEFYQEGLESLGAVCERTWHDRLHLVAEGPAARLWEAQGGFVEREISFPPADATTTRNANGEVFPGCPLTFRLAETLRSIPLTFERVLLAPVGSPDPPDPKVTAKLWHQQFPNTRGWRPESAFRSDHLFSLLALVRCEIQAIDQHWSVHRLALSLPEGRRDDDLAQRLDFCDVTEASPLDVSWPPAETIRWKPLVQAALAEELQGDLLAIRARQTRYLQRELDRIDRYFEGYQRELTGRQSRRKGSDAHAKYESRLAAAKLEHQNRVLDQIHRHEVKVLPHVDALLLLAEPAWAATVSFELDHRPMRRPALFNPRNRHWSLCPGQD